MTVDYLIDHLSIVMFAVLALLLFSGYPVGLVLGGVAFLFGGIGMYFGVFSAIEFFNFLPRIWGGAADNLVLIAAPLFIFMGIVLEKSRIAEDLLHSLQILLRRVPGGLALAVTIMGTIMAATTGIIGASVVMLSTMALPAMLKQGYHKGLATGTIAASGTLGILIPPSIMLVLMADLMQISAGKLFVGALFPGLLLSALYLIFIVIRAKLKPSVAPPLGDDVQVDNLASMVMRSFLPPTILVMLVLGSIFFGWATPTEAAGVGAAGAIVLTAAKGRLTWSLLDEAVRSSTLTIGMVFLVIMAATCFSYVFRSLGGDDVILDFIKARNLDGWDLLLILMVIIFLLGFFFDWIEITLIVLPIFTPIIAAADFGGHVAEQRDVIYWFAILVAVNLQTSFLTPPFGFALFFIKGCAPPQVRMEDIYRGIVPFVCLQLLGLALTIVFPELALWLPRVVMGD